MPRRRWRKSKLTSSPKTTDAPGPMTTVSLSTASASDNTHDNQCGSPSPSSTSSLQISSNVANTRTEKSKCVSSVRFEDQTISGLAGSDWCTKEDLSLLGTVHAFDISPERQAHAVDWIQVAKIMNSQKLPGIRGNNYFEPDMCKDEYIKLLKLYGNLVGPMHFGEDLCSRALRYLISEYEMADSRTRLFDNHHRKQPSMTLSSLV